MIVPGPAPTPVPFGVRFLAPPGRLPLGAIFGAIGVAGTAAVAVLGLHRLPFPVCLFKLTTGLPCPTCGSTRAAAHLAHLELAQAFAMNPLTTAGMLVIVAWAAADALLLARGRALDLEVGSRMGNLLRVAAVLAVAVNWAYLIAAGR
jgi:hypothetical protein